MKTITTQWLEEIDACENQYEIFVEEWPSGTEVTRENLERAAEIGLDLVWFARRVLPRDIFINYDKELNSEHFGYLRSLSDKYLKELCELDAEYEAKCSTLTTQSTVDEHSEKRRVLWAAFRNDNDAARLEYVKKHRELVIDTLCIHYEI